MLKLSKHRRIIIYKPTLLQSQPRPRSPGHPVLTMMHGHPNQPRPRLPLSLLPRQLLLHLLNRRSNRRHRWPNLRPCHPRARWVSSQRYRWIPHHYSPPSRLRRRCHSCPRPRRCISRLPNNRNQSSQAPPRCLRSWRRPSPELQWANLLPHTQLEEPGPWRLLSQEISGLPLHHQQGHSQPRKRLPRVNRSPWHLILQGFQITCSTAAW